MSNMFPVIRWIAALLCAPMIFVLIFVAGAVVWRQLGTNAVTTMRISECLAAGAAVLGGALCVPRPMARTAALIIWVLVLVLPGWILAEGILTGQFEIMAFWEFADVLLGGFGGFWVIRAAGLGSDRHRPIG